VRTQPLPCRRRVPFRALLGAVLLAWPAGPAGAAPREAGPGSPAAPRRRIEELRAEIARHDRLYFEQAEPEISDFAYDQLKRELAELEEASPEAGTDAAPGGTIARGGFPSGAIRCRC